MRAWKGIETDGHTRVVRRAPRLLSKPGVARLRGAMGSRSRWQRIGLRNGTASRNVEPEIDPFKGVVLLSHFTKWPRAATW